MFSSYTTLQLLKYILRWSFDKAEDHQMVTLWFREINSQIKNLKPDPFFENLRKKHRKDPSTLHPSLYGSGSGPVRRKISRIATAGITPVRYSLLFTGLIRYFNLKTILELGTSLGINTLYLSTALKDVSVYTFEGDPDLAAIARDHFENTRRKNIQLVVGDINETLPGFLKNNMEPDFIYMDANHRYEPSKRYFNMLFRSKKDPSVIIIDDIYRSPEMTRFWKDTIADYPDTLRMDLFRMGILVSGTPLPGKYLRIVY